MVNIFFVPGMFGSTLEYMLRNFTNEFDSVEGKILDDGSMHSFKKRFHSDEQGIEKLFETFNENIDITTVFYPEKTHNLKWIIENWPGNLSTSKNLLLTAFTKNDAELVLLFQHYKIALNSLNLGLSKIFFNHINFTQWNVENKHWSDLHIWELRESFSLFYPKYVCEFIEKDCSYISNVKTISYTDFLYQPYKTFSNIVEHCNLSYNSNNITDFLQEWCTKQQYIIDEFNLITTIVDSTLRQINFDWHDRRLCIISEAIIQQRLREQGFEIQCWDLNSFPTNTETLSNILEKI